ncbi:MAG: arginine--tRNA ligase [Candidatus Beckwithbacteria bacterium]|nr:arginine--tRNA ligase [Candidatus Beckwithbacteria bacterium]
MRQIIEQTIKKVLKELGVKPVKFSVEHPENMAWGDYTTNVGIITHKAEEIGAKLKAEESLNKIASKIEVKGAGFINISIKSDALVSQVNQVLKGNWEKPLLGKKISVEYTDPNPFKEFHLGHLYSNLIGEAIAKIFEASGVTVWRGNFYGDVGMHVAKSVWGMQQKLTKEKIAIKDLEKKSIKDRQNFLGQGYALGVRAFEEDEKIKKEITELNKKIYDKDESVKEIYEAGLSWSLEYFETYYKRLGTKFDGYYPESKVAVLGKKLVEKGLKKGVLEKSEGAVVFKGEKYGLHTRVFLNKFGLPTYEAKDLGLAQAKYQDFKYDRSLNVFGKEIDEYYRVVKKTLELIEPELGKKAEWLAHGMVKLPEGKMSSRSGNVITADWLLNEAKGLIQKNFKCDDEVAEQIGLGAVKYALLKSGIGQDVIFDFAKSISFEGNSGPYLQYTYARARSVLKKAHLQGDSSQVCEESPYCNQEEEILLRSLVRFEETIVQAAEELAPDVVAKFLYDLAQKFNSFYNKHRVIGNDFRLWLTSATGEILKKGLGLLGISAPEKM